MKRIDRITKNYEISVIKYRFFFKTISLEKKKTAQRNSIQKSRRERGRQGRPFGFKEETFLFYFRGDEKFLKIRRDVSSSAFSHPETFRTTLAIHY